MNTLVGMMVSHWVESLLWIGYFAVVFGVLTRIWPCNPESHYWRSGRQILCDLCYWLIVPLVTRYVKLLFVFVGATLLLQVEGEAAMREYFTRGHGVVGAWPLIIQSLVILVVSDVLLFLIHRGFHGRALWKFHAVHHSPRTLDWMSTQRFHPINSWCAFVLVDTLMLLAGFAPEAFAQLALFNVVMSAFVHANLNWTLGPLKYVIATPVFHRWHHTTLAEGRNKNFAPTFPVLDLLCGTFYMPKDRLPSDYGVEDPAFPEGFLAQMLYPFHR